MFKKLLSIKSKMIVEMHLLIKWMRLCYFFRNTSLFFIITYYEYASWNFSQDLRMSKEITSYIFINLFSGINAFYIYIVIPCVCYSVSLPSGKFYIQTTQSRIKHSRKFFIFSFQFLMQIFYDTTILSQFL